MENDLSGETSSPGVLAKAAVGKVISIISIAIGLLCVVMLVSALVADKALGLDSGADFVAVSTGVLLFLTPLSCACVFIGVLGAFLNKRRKRLGILGSILNVGYLAVLVYIVFTIIVGIMEQPPPRPHTLSCQYAMEA